MSVRTQSCRNDMGVPVLSLSCRPEGGPRACPSTAMPVRSTCAAPCSVVLTRAFAADNVAGSLPHSLLNSFRTSTEPADVCKDLPSVILAQLPPYVLTLTDSRPLELTTTARCCEYSPPISPCSLKQCSRGQRRRPWRVSAGALPACPRITGLGLKAAATVLGEVTTVGGLSQLATLPHSTPASARCRGPASDRRTLLSRRASGQS